LLENDSAEMGGNSRTYLTLKALIAIIFCLIGLQYLSLLQVNEKQRRPGESRALFYFERDDQKQNSLLDDISEFLKPSVSLSELDLLPLKATTTTEKKFFENGTISELKVCPMIPPNLRGAVKVQTDNIPSMEEMEKTYSFLEDGGRFKPNQCIARHRVAIIVPFRDREEHLRTFLFHMHSFLPRQQVDYGIFIVEQDGSGAFNRAMLLNVGAAEALKSYDFQCFIFHDVDLLPEDDRNLYTCPVQPRHMSVAINNFLYRLPYDDIFGGVSAMTVDQFRQVNGFSNMFWGWGGEDDDMSNRLRQKKLYISRYPANIARYRMLKHNKDKANPDRFKYLYSGAKRIDKDGYNSLKYKPVKIVPKRLFTWILVDLPHLTL